MMRFQHRYRLKMFNVVITIIVNNVRRRSFCAPGTSLASASIYASWPTLRKKDWEPFGPTLEFPSALCGALMSVFRSRIDATSATSRRRHRRRSRLRRPSRPITPPISPSLTRPGILQPRRRQPSNSITPCRRSASIQSETTRQPCRQEKGPRHVSRKDDRFGTGTRDVPQPVRVVVWLSGALAFRQDRFAVSTQPREVFSKAAFPSPVERLARQNAASRSPMAGIAA